MPPNVPPNTPPSDEAKTSPRARSSVTYPSKNGSDVDRSAGFWSWLTLASSVTGFKQSMVANVSEPDYESLKVVQEYLSKYCHYRILDEFSEWFPELIATMAAWCELEAITPKSEAGIPPPYVDHIPSLSA